MPFFLQNLFGNITCKFFNKCIIFSAKKNNVYTHTYTVNEQLNTQDGYLKIYLLGGHLILTFTDHMSTKI